MIVIGQPGAHLAVTQQAHAEMCGQLAAAWGNELFGAVDPADSLRLAAEQHELGMLEWDLAPELDRSTGLPVTVRGMKLSAHLPLRLRGPERVRELDPYAALMVSLHHTSFYSRPPAHGLLRRRGRQINAYLDRSEAFQRELQADLGVSDAEMERNWRLVRTWDGLSHDLLHERLPGTLDAVPAEGGRRLALRLARRGDLHTLDPWPFRSERVAASAEAIRLEHGYRDRESLRRGLEAAPRVELRYELAPA